MTSDIIDSGPFYTEKEYVVPLDFDEDTGFPFENDFDTNPHNFRTNLDDIAQRYPQFSEHLTGFPFSTSPNTNRRRFVDRPFGDRFEHFAGFPFDDEYTEPEFEERAKATHPQPQAENTPQEPERSRRPPKNIQQSNTVDLGQKSQELDDQIRVQRSMSAPPSENRRFVSSVNIPMNMGPQDGAGAHSQQGERVIPIHVEGRDEPVVPKRVNTSQQAPPRGAPQQQQAPPPQQQQQPQQQGGFFAHRPSHFTQFLNRDPTRGFKENWQPSDWFHKPFGGAAAPPGQDEDRLKQEELQRKHEELKRQQEELRRQEEDLKRQEEEYKRQQAEKFRAYKEATPPPQHVPQAAPVPPPQTAPQKPTPIDTIKLIQKDVSALMLQVEQFAGQPRDKQYLYLDEMLTRNLLKLDDVDTQGQDNIRSARKEAIKCIERCISMLETKAQQNVAPPPTQMEVEASEMKPEDGANSAETQAEATEVNENLSQVQMEVEEPKVVEENTVITLGDVETQEQVPETQTDPAPAQSSDEAVPPATEDKKDKKKKKSK